MVPCVTSVCLLLGVPRSRTSPGSTCQPTFPRILRALFFSPMLVIYFDPLYLLKSLFLRGLTVNQSSCPILFYLSACVVTIESGTTCPMANRRVFLKYPVPSYHALSYTTLSYPGACVVTLHSSHESSHEICPLAKNKDSFYCTVSSQLSHDHMIHHTTHLLRYSPPTSLVPRTSSRIFLP